MNMPPAAGWRPWYRGACALGLALAALPAAAQVTGPLTGNTLFFNQASNAHTGNYLAATAGLLYTSNAQYSTNGTADTLVLLGLSGNTEREGTRLDYHLDSDVAALKYLKGSFGTQLTGYLDGEAAFKIVPGFFSWIARETYTQLQIDPFAPATPTNVENLNFITTGPRFTLRPTLRTSVTLDGLYSYVSSSSSSPQFVNLDSNRYGADLKADRAFSSTSSLYIKGSYQKVEFKDQAENNNYAVADGVGGFRLQGARTNLDVSGGYSRIQVYDVLTPVDTILGTVERPETQTFSAPTWSFSLSRLITPSQRVALYASQQFTDAAAVLRLSFDQPVPTIAPTQLAVGDPFKSRDFGADWRFETPRTSIDVGVLDTRQRYVVSSNDNSDRDLKLASVMLARQLSPVLNWDIGATYQHTEFTNTQTTINVTTVLTNLRWRLGERLGLRFLYAFSTQYGVHTNQVGIIASYALTAGALPDTTQPQNPALQPISPQSMQAPPR
jgi:hypothetical protein